MAAFEEKYVSCEMDVEGQSEKLRLSLILLHSHVKKTVKTSSERMIMLI